MKERMKEKLRDLIADFKHNTNEIVQNLPCIRIKDVYVNFLESFESACLDFDENCNVIEKEYIPPKFKKVLYIGKLGIRPFSNIEYARYYGLIDEE